MKRMALLLLGIILCFSVVSCGSNEIKIPSWLIGTWTCTETGEEMEFTENNVVFYSKLYNTSVELLDVQDDIVGTIKDANMKYSVKNSNSSKGYTLTVLNKDNGVGWTMDLVKNSSSSYSYEGYTFTR